MLIISPNKLSTLKNQLLSIRNDILRLDVFIPSSSIQKTAFLSAAAHSFGYANWNQLQSLTNSSHKQSINEVVFTEATIQILAIKLRNKFCLSDFDLDTIEQLIFNHSSDDEKKGLPDYNFVSISPPDVHRLELGPKSRYLMNFMLWRFDIGSITIDKATKFYCQELAEKRKALNLTKAEAKKQHLDVYPKSGMTVDAIVNEGVKDDYLVLDNEMISLSETGVWWIRNYITDDYSDHWKQWFSELEKLYIQLPYRRAFKNWDHIITLYAKNKTASETIKDHLAWGGYYNESHTNIRSLIKDCLGVDLPLYPKGRYFYFKPCLFYDYEVNKSDLEFEFIGPEWALPPESQNVGIYQYAPNKCYYQIGLSKKSELGGGWIVEIPDHVDEFDVSFCWKHKEGEFKPVTHTVTYSLKPDHLEERNWLYLTNSKYQSGSNYTFARLETLLGHKELTKEEVMDLPRVKAGIKLIELSKERNLTIKEEKNVIASNCFNPNNYA